MLDKWHVTPPLVAVVGAALEVPAAIAVPVAVAIADAQVGAATIVGAVAGCARPSGVGGLAASANATHLKVYVVTSNVPTHSALLGAKTTTRLEPWPPP